MFLKNNLLFGIKSSIKLYLVNFVLFSDSSLEKHSMQSSSDHSSTHDSVLKVETRTATGSDLTPSEDEDDFSTQEDWEAARDHVEQTVFRYSGDFVDPVFPPKVCPLISF